jgi:hypothetical protein
MTRMSTHLPCRLCANAVDVGQKTWRISDHPTAAAGVALLLTDNICQLS